MVTTSGLRMINATLIFGLCAIALLLSGCTSHPHVNAYNENGNAYGNEAASLDNRKIEEEQAWARIAGLSQSRCGVAGVPERTSAVDQSACVTDIVYEHVLPVAMYPALVKKTRGDAMRIAQDYAAGKMTPAEYTARSQARLRNYKTQWSLLSAQAKVGFVQTVHVHQRKAPLQQPVKTALN
ncbi:MAG: hypothetical protein PSY14_07405 [bacterium]|nr:hypothetical protein [bacterium]